MLCFQGGEQLQRFADHCSVDHLHWLARIFSLPPVGIRTCRPSGLLKLEQDRPPMHIAMLAATPHAPGEHACERLVRETDFQSGSLNLVQRTSHSAPAAIQHMGVDHRRRHLAVAQQLLNRADVVAGLQHVSRERMAQNVR